MPNDSPSLKDEWLEALSLYAGGNTTDEIAAQCFVSHRGAEYRLRCAADVPECDTIREAAVKAAQLGLI